MTKITTDLTGTENAATRHTRIKAIYDWYFGTGAYVAAGNLGVVRAALNGLLVSDIANGETFASWLIKLNAMNDVDTFVPSILFAGGHRGIVIDPEVLGSMSQDTAGATPVTAASQPVGRILDRSGNTYHFIQATASSRPTYMLDGSSRPHLAFDAVDDWMISTSFDWLTDAVTVVVAADIATSATQRVIVKGGNTTAANGWSMIKSAANALNMTSAGTASAPAISGTGNAFGNAIYTCIADISTPVATARKSGVQLVTTAATQGTGAYATSGINLGSLGGGFPTGMSLYGMLLINRVLNAQELGWAEKWMARKNGVTLP